MYKFNVRIFFSQTHKCNMRFYNKRMVFFFTSSYINDAISQSQKCQSHKMTKSVHCSIMLTLELIMDNKFKARNVISFQHMSTQCSCLGLHLTTHHSNKYKKDKQFNYLCLHCSIKQFTFQYDSTPKLASNTPKLNVV